MKTKKVRRQGVINKKEMWNNFQNECQSEKTQIECVFTNIGTRELCDCCDSNIEITEEGFMACTNKKCGIMYKDILDHSAEWRFYGAEDSHVTDPTRAGPPINPLLQESSFGCKVMCPGKSSYEMRKIRRYSEWQSMPYREKSQYDEFQRITVLAGQAGIPKIIIDDAMRYHKKISEAKSFRGLNRHGIIAASIYVASRLNSYPRTAKEIATIFNLENTSATKGCKNAISIINELEHDMHNREKTTLCRTTPHAFIERYCSRLNINSELTKLCNFVAIRVQKNNLIPENTPHSIAAGIIYFVAQVCNINVTKRDVNNISEISEVTINKCYKKLDTMKSQLIPSVILRKYG